MRTGLKANAQVWVRLFRMSSSFKSLQVTGIGPLLGSRIYVYQLRVTISLSHLIHTYTSVFLPFSTINVL